MGSKSVVKRLHVFGRQVATWTTETEEKPKADEEKPQLGFVVREKGESSG